MAANFPFAHDHDENLRRLPLHIRRDSTKLKDPLIIDRATTPTHDGHRKRFPEGLQFTPSSFRLRSRTASTRSSISSANLPDSATICSVSTLASPISTSYASDIQDLLAAHTIIDGSRPPSRFRHRHKPSDATCSTFVNEEDDARLVAGHPKFDLLGFGAAHSHFNVTPIGENQPEPESEVDDVASQPDAPVKEEEDRTPGDTHEWHHIDQHSEFTHPKWETASASSADSSSEDVDELLSYTLQLVYGVHLSETNTSVAPLRQLASKFIDDVGQHIWQAPSDTQTNQTMSTTSSSSTPSNGGGASESQGNGKRKKQVPGGRDDDGEYFSDGEGSGDLPVKRARPNPKDEENLRLSCPFRKRNPQRFNVRDHHSCAMTYFPKFAELRQHIVKQHKRDDPSAFVCDRCNRDFRTRKELRDHQRQPKEQMCDISDNDPEAGIDGPTSNKLLSRKRASGTSAGVQWREIWNILFPDDEDDQIRSYDFTPVIEHFELSTLYLTSFNLLQTSLRDKISNPATLETLATKFHQCFIETVEQCISGAQNMPYANRSNKKNEPARPPSTQNLMQRKVKDVKPRPDSGVVLDDGSEESGSVTGVGVGMGMGMGTGLMHKDSVRTVRGASRRGSNLVNETVREIAPTPSTDTIFDPQLLEHCLTTMPLDTLNSQDLPMNLAAVHTWNNGVMHQQGDAGFGTPDQFLGVAGMTPQDGTWEDASFYTADFGDTFKTFY